MSNGSNLLIFYSSMSIVFLKTYATIVKLTKELLYTFQIHAVQELVPMYEILSNFDTTVNAIHYYSYVKSDIYRQVFIVTNLN